MKALTDWTEADLAALASGSQREGRRWEFKRDQYQWNDEGTREFLADVSSFANAGGGMLLIGIDDEDGCASEVVGVCGPVDDALQRMTQKVRTGLDPRVSGVEMRAIPVHDNRNVLAIRVSRSWAAPHMVTFKNYSRFFSRTSAGKYQLDVNEIRAQILAGSELADRLRNFRLARINEVVSRTIPFPLREGPSLMLHVIPLSAFDPGHRIGMPAIGEVNSFLHPFRRRGYSWRINFDGLATFTNVGDDEVSTYIQLFRNGVVEATDTGLLEEWDGNRVIPSEAMERDLLEVVEQFRLLMAHLDIGLPFAWMFTLLGVRGYTMAVGMGRTTSREVDRDILSVPEFIQEDTSSPGEIVKRLIDPVWQACGREHSPNFDDEGEWSPR